MVLVIIEETVLPTVAMCLNLFYVSKENKICELRT